MDPISATASLVALVGLADQLLNLCTNYLRALKNAPKDLRSILIEVGSVKYVLETLRLCPKLLSKVRRGPNEEGPLEGCDQALKQLLALLPTESSHSTKRKRSKFVPSYAELAWPLKEFRARKALEDLGRYKAAIILILMTDTAQDIKSIKITTEGIANKLSDQEQESILKWLVQGDSDPSVNHNRACQLHEPHTGNWLLRSTEYQDILGGLNRFLWLYGIPGAGKTILASFIIQNIQKFYEDSERNDVGCCYYYCFYGRKQDETVPLLCRIIYQLCRQLKVIPNKLHAAYETARQPGYEVLTNLLFEVTARFRRVYIVIDALDESENRKYLFDLISRINQDTKISLIVTSRNYEDIRQALKGIGSSTSLSNPLVDEDIRVYIESHVREDHMLNRWDDAFKKEIRDALVQGAQGMFRWAACQLEILRTLHSRPEIQKALRELPETLEETYERILAKISPSNRPIALRALHVLAATEGVSVLTLEMLADASVVDVVQRKFSCDDRLFHPTNLLEICVCLIREDRYGIVFLAHYTVEEYLNSDRILSGAAAMFKTSHIESGMVTAKICIIYLMNLPYNELVSAEEYLKSGERNDPWERSRKDTGYPFIAFALDYVFDQVCRLDAFDAQLTEMICELFDPQREHFRGLEDQATITQYIYDDDYFRLKSFPEAPLSITLAYLCYYNFTEVAKDFLTQNPDPCILESYHKQDHTHLHSFDSSIDVEGQPLQIAAMLDCAEMVKVLLDCGANPNARHGVWNLLTAALRSPVDDDYDDVVSLLLEAGADPNPSGVCKTPLQLAVERGHNLEVIRKLLAAGADANAVGDSEAILIDMKRQNNAKEQRSRRQLEHRVLL